MKGLDLVIAFRLIDGCEHWLHSAKQTQPHDLPNHMWMRMASTKRAFVVELLKERQAQICPSFQQMRACGGTRLVRLLTQLHGVAEQINRMKVFNLFAAIQLAGDNIGGVNGIHFPSDRPRVIRCLAAGTQRMRQLMRCQDALNGRPTGQRLKAQSLQVSSNRAAPDESISRFGSTSRFEGLAPRDDGVNHMPRHLLGRRLRRTRLVSKVGLRVTSIFCPPLAEPARTAIQRFTNIAAAFAPQATAHCLSTYFLLGRLSVHASSC